MRPDTIGHMPETRIYRPDECPDVEVLADGTWWRGELRAWIRRDDDWVADVQVSPSGEHPSHLDTFSVDDVRVDTVGQSTATSP